MLVHVTPWTLFVFARQIENG